MFTRRKFFSGAAALIGGSALFKQIARGAEAVAAQSVSPTSTSSAPYPATVTPNGSSLPWKMIDGVKEFRATPGPSQLIRASYGTQVPSCSALLNS